MKDNGFGYNVDTTPLKVSNNTLKVDIKDKIKWSIADAKLKELGIDLGSTLYGGDDTKELETDDINIVLDCLANDRKIPEDVEKRLKEKIRTDLKKKSLLKLNLH